MAKIKVYHGSNCEVKEPSLSYGREDADFGIGFYVTTDVEMAEKWAARRHNPIINVYEVDLDSLNGLEFGLNKGWLDFVVQNRSGNKRIEIDLSDTDYIKGATADDRLFAVVEQYESNLLDVDTAIKAMNAMQIGEQIALVSAESIDNLKFCSSYNLSEERRTELKNMLVSMRKETNEIVERILRDKVKEEKEKPGPMPVFRKKKGR